MADRDVELGRGECSGERAVDVAGHDHEVRPELHEEPLELDQCFAGLLAVGAGADRELVVRLRERQLLEEDVVDLAVVMLAGMDEPLLDVAEPLELRIDRRDLHVVRARAYHVDDQFPHDDHVSNCVRQGACGTTRIRAVRRTASQTSSAAGLHGRRGPARNPGRKRVVRVAARNARCGSS